MVFHINYIFIHAAENFYRNYFVVFHLNYTSFHAFYLLCHQFDHWRTNIHFSSLSVKIHQISVRVILLWFIGIMSTYETKT